MSTVLHTIETDPLSPFGEKEVPPAEWTYRDWLRHALERGPMFIAAYVRMAGERGMRYLDAVPEFPQHASLERTVAAYVNWSRWLWDCPICRAAQCCTPNDPRAFCVECFNGGDGWWPIVFPDDIVQITVLLERRDAKNAHWSVGEPIENLQHENLALGLPSDAPDLPPLVVEQVALAAVAADRALNPPADEPKAIEP